MPRGIFYLFNMLCIMRSDDHPFFLPCNIKTLVNTPGCLKFFMSFHVETWNVRGLPPQQSRIHIYMYAADRAVLRRQGICSCCLVYRKQNQKCETACESYVKRVIIFTQSSQSFHSSFPWKFHQLWKLLCERHAKSVWMSLSFFTIDNHMLS